MIPAQQFAAMSILFFAIKIRNNCDTVSNDNILVTSFMQIQPLVQKLGQIKCLVTQGPSNSMQQNPPWQNVTQLVKKFHLACSDPEVSSPYLQQPATGPCLQQLNSFLSQNHLLKINFIIITYPRLGFEGGILPSGLPTKISDVFYIVLVCGTCSHISSFIF
jgi:hypothetical protein